MANNIRSATGAGNNGEYRFEGEAKATYERLLDIREELLGEVRELSDASLIADKQAGEELADVGSDNFLREMEIGLVSEEGRRIRLIDEAIERLKKGEYGVCIDCDKPINPRRLEALPYARLCIQCKAERERAEALGRA